MKFSAPGAVITVGSRVVEDGVELSVRQEGPGIGEADRERIFERFGRVDSSKAGAGLGLPIVAAVAQAHGERSAVTRSWGRGPPSPCSCRAADPASSRLTDQVSTLGDSVSSAAVSSASSSPQALRKSAETLRTAVPHQSRLVVSIPRDSSHLPRMSAGVARRTTCGAALVLRENDIHGPRL